AGLNIGNDANRIEIEEVKNVAANASITGAGDIFIRQVTAATNKDLTVENVTKVGGNASLDVVSAVTDLTGVKTLTNNGNVTLTAAAGNLTVKQNVSANGTGYVDLRANGSVGDIAIQGATVQSTGNGTVQLIAAGNITTNTATGTTSEILTKGDALLRAGLNIGNDANRIEIEEVKNVAANASITGAGDIFIRQVTAATNKDLTVENVTKVGGNASLDVVSAVTDLTGVKTLTNNGNVTLTAAAGNLTVKQNVSANGTGYVDLRANGSVGDIAIQGATVQSTGNGTVQLIAAGNITTNTATGTTSEILTKGDALLRAGLNIGNDANRIEIEEVKNVAANASITGAGDIFIRQVTAATNKDLTVENVTKVGGNASLDVVSAVTDLTGVKTLTNNGNVTLTAAAGNLTVKQNVSANGTGYVDLRANGSVGDIAIQGATVQSTGNGTVQLIAAGNITTNTATEIGRA